MLAIMFVIVAWTMLIAWVAKLAQAHGRSVILWAFGAAAAGILAFALGLYVANRVLDLESESTGVTMLAIVAPLFLMGISMVGIGAALKRSPIHVALGKDWPVHFVDRGPGRLRVRDGKVAFEWRDGTREVAVRQLLGVEADGECVRVRFPDDHELCFMPMGKPETPAGRRQQSLQLARRLR